MKNELRETDWDNHLEVKRFFKKVTGYSYSFAVATGEILGDKFKDTTCYQLMEDDIDDGFFDWYCYNLDDDQFFLSKEVCVISFLAYYMSWNNKGKPKFNE